jgi:hypothetical protein
MLRNKNVGSVVYVGTKIKYSHFPNLQDFCSTASQPAQLDFSLSKNKFVKNSRENKMQFFLFLQTSMYKTAKKYLNTDKTMVLEFLS